MATAQRAPAATIRAAAVKLIKSREGKNKYSQNATLRERVFETPGYGDCSSTVRNALARAGLGFSIGSSTNQQVQNRTTRGIVVDKSSTGYPNEANLLPGDCLYFKGNTAHTLDVGHVEMYTGKNECYGHGSGMGPKRHNLRDYCRSRISKRTRYFMAIRWAFDFGERVLSLGSYGADVAILQRALLDAGYQLLGTTGPKDDGVDGDFGSATDKAVRWYQGKIGVSINGRVDATLAARLMSGAKPDEPEPEPDTDDDDEIRDYPLGSRELDNGDTGSDVAELQQAFIRLGGAAAGYKLGTTGDNKDGVDGEFGPLTEACVKLFQTRSNLEATGVFDDVTFEALKNSLAGVTVPGDEPEPIVYPAFGYIPDVSSNNVTFRAARVAETCLVVIMRARVSGKTDRVYVERAKALNALDFPHIAYDFLDLVSVPDAINQANAMYDLVMPLNPQAIATDVETLADGVSYKDSAKDLAAYVGQMRKRALADGKTIKIGSYMGTSRHEHYKELDGIFDFLWPATWGSNDGTLKVIPSYGDIHQFTSRFPAKEANYGIPGGRDMNRLTGRKPASYFTGRVHDGSGYVGIAKVTGDTVNIRAQASTGSKRLGTVTRGAIFARRPGDVDGWAAVWFKNQPAFISTQNVKMITG